jgi:hypothetical protein
VPSGLAAETANKIYTKHSKNTSKDFHFNQKVRTFIQRALTAHIKGLTVVVVDELGFYGSVFFAE